MSWLLTAFLLYFAVMSALCLALLTVMAATRVHRDLREAAEDRADRAAFDADYFSLDCPRLTLVQVDEVGERRRRRAERAGDAA
jgi:hypothetical protein